MVTPTFIFSVIILTMAVLAFGTTQTYLRFSASGPDSGCRVSKCARPDGSHAADGTGGVADGSAHGSSLPSSGPVPATSTPTGHGHAKVRIAYLTVRTLPGGFVGLISITGRSGSLTRTWWLSVRYPGVRITEMTGATWHTDADGTVTIEPLSQTPELRPGATLPITFSASGRAGAPSGCRFDGNPCHISGNP